MIRLDCEQGGPSWMKLRLGLPTCSQYDRILTPKTKKYASGAKSYMHEILTEWLLGYPIDTGSSGWMDRGTDMEAEAVAWYEFQRDVKVERVGFVRHDELETGGSPDGLVGTDGGLEVKCPAAKTHVGYLLNPDSLVDEYVCQVQGYMWITGRPWWDVLSYSPDLPSVLVRVERDEAHLKAFDDAIRNFLFELDGAKTTLREHKKTSILDYITEDAA